MPFIISSIHHHSKLLDWFLRFLVLLSCYAQLALASLPQQPHGEGSSSSSNNTSPNNNHNGGDEHGGIHIFRAEFQHVAKPFGVCAWVLAASIAKIVFHHFEKLSSTIPESCLLILLGIPVGYILEAVGLEQETGNTILTTDLFFFYLLPPIILDAGYFMPTHVFFANIGTILLYAVFGTIFNTFAVGIALWGISGLAKIKISLLQGLLFGSLVSAVDPVAVLAVFEEVHVHEILYMLVFGESVLNDAASVVLYRTFESLINGKVDAEQIGLAFVSFFTVSLGGALVGLVFALATSFITKFTEHVRVIEPVFIFLMAYMSYLTAEIFHFSGIISILFCGTVMKPYVESNMSRKSHTTVKYFLKLLSSSADSIIFMFLGVSLVQYNHLFNVTFVVFTLLFTTLFRAVGVVLLTYLANKFGRLDRVKKVEQFIMSYGGLRGAVAFSLAILIKSDPDDDQFTRTIVTTTITVVMFTTFIQGTTIKKMVDILGVRRSEKRVKGMGEALNDRTMGYMVAGIEEIMGVHGHGFWRDLFDHFNKKVLRRLLERDPDNPLDDNLLTHQRRIAFKNALNYATNPSIMFARENDAEMLNHITSNPSVAMHLALKAQDESQLEGDYSGVLDINALSQRYNNSGEGGVGGNNNISSEAFNHIRISSLIPKAKRQNKKTFSQRKYTLTSLDEDVPIEDRFRRNQALPLVPLHSRPLGHQINNHHKHHKKKGGAGQGHHHKHRSHHKRMPTSTSKLTKNEVGSGIDSGIDTSISSIPLSEIPSPSSTTYDDNTSSSNNDDIGEDDDMGIVLHFSDKNERSAGTGGPFSTVPSIPSADYADSPKLSRYMDTGLRDGLVANEAKKWRSYTILSDDGVEVIANRDAVVDVPEIHVTSDDDDNDNTEQGGRVSNGETKF